MKMHWPARVALVAVLWLSSGTARAWQCIDAGCPVWCTLPVQYQIGDLPPGLDEAMAISEIQRAAAVWSEPGCTSLTLEYGGRLADGVVPGAIVVDWPTTWTAGTSTINLAQPMWSTEGCIEGGRIDNNLVDYTWVLDPGAATTSSVHLFTLVAAGFGRTLGLGSSSDADSLVYFTYTGGARSGLSTDDIAGICNLYTAEGLTCAADAPCEGDLMCVDGVCVPTPATTGAGTSCERCMTMSDCIEGNTCVRFPDGISYCVGNCVAEEDCATGEGCFAIAGGIGVCAPSDGIGVPTCDSSPDAGAPDASRTTDAGPDGSVDGSVDGGSSSAGGGGCDCDTTSARRAPSASWLTVVGVVGLLGWRRRERRR